MSDLSISRKNIYSIFSERGVNFLIPDYQRPYSWENEHCETLWEDLKAFAFPEDKDFDDDNDEYFLGTIVTFKNDYGQNEVIDGQQRLITLHLLLRAFYAAFGEMQNRTYARISECIWHMDKNDNPDMARLKINSEVATDDDIVELKKIVTDGETTEKNKSLYAENYRYFQKKIEEFKLATPDRFSVFSKRILDNCILLPIETNSQGTALRIFTTLNDRGMPLSDSDIFKAQFYKLYKTQGRQAKENFVRRWKDLESLCNKNFHPRTGTPVDDLFMRYMYYLLAKDGVKSDTFKGLRPYYEQDNYKILRSEKTFEDLETLAKFWEDVAERDAQRFSERVLRRLYVLSFSPHSLWSYIVSLYFMGNKDSQDLLDDEKFYRFLQKITAMILMHSIANPGTHNVRRPFFVEFQNILRGVDLRFKYYLQDRKFFREQLRNTKFSQTKKITRAMLTWWTFHDEKQELPPLGTPLEIEHIYARNRANFEPLKNPENLELLGNKILLEKRINIRAADYRFADKKKYYRGYTPAKGKFQRGTDNLELLQLVETHADFTENDILERNEKILSAFIEYLAQNNLLR